ncbi:hypothetical protein EAD89_03120 [Micromonospora sp. BL4]|uniref:hypothetical protein n=1 Tax=Micromonospora sp. BL4 TaxID=2478710 RepID=UPI000EF5EC5F|nr:hypothetical protein [Micromonospora sp. BL4]RLP94651.1 hypothetical protein EAD89_03120 [Micromonospora sp. BL4]
MEALFQFAQVRQPLTTDAPEALDLSADTELQQRLAAVASEPDSLARMKRLAEEFAAGPHYVTGEGTTGVVGATRAVSEALARSERPLDLADLLGRPVADFLADPQTVAGIADIKDSVLVVKLLPAEHRRPIARLVDALRIHDYISSGEKRLLRIVRLPAWFGRGPRPASPPRDPVVIRDRLAELAARHEAVDAAIAELAAVPASGFRRTAQREYPQVLPPENLRPQALFERDLTIRRKELELSLRLPDLPSPAPGIRAQPGAEIAISGRPEFLPMTDPVGVRLDTATIDRLDGRTKEALQGLKVDPSNHLPDVVSALLRERRALHESAQSLVGSLLPRATWWRRGDVVVSRANGLLADVRRRTPRELLDLFDPLESPPVPDPVPRTHADLGPAGVMDLYVVRQQLKGYARDEIAYVENVMRSESRDRVRRTRTETETIFVQEREQEHEESSSLTTTDRFEMQRETQSLLQERSDVKGSLTVSGSYGPTVDFQASAEAAWTRNTEESESSASTMAREVTQTAAERTAERILTRQTRRTTTEVEETDQHTFNNTLGAEHVVGVYQWLTKVYEAQVYNYGRRTLYDVLVPEPGAQLIEAFRRSRAEVVDIVEPVPFSVRPEELHPDTYQSFVTMYGATGIKPPPQPFATEAYDFHTGGEESTQEFTDSTRVKVPDGYRAVQASVGVVTTIWDGWSVDVVMGRRAHRFGQGSPWVWITDLDGETEAVPFALTTDKVGHIACAVEVTCAATPRALAVWQHETHAQLVEAYRSRLSEYEAKLATAEATAPPVVVSREAYRNRATMVDELKRMCVTLLTEQHFELFDATTTGPDGLPRIRFDQAGIEGAYVRFFEQAFEWENMSWVCYPYFWGRRSSWLERLDIRDGDLEFEDFLKAGYARLVLPVRPGFEPAVDHFRKTGDPWQGGPLPTVSDDTYLPIADEIAERLGVPGSEVPVGEPWEVRVPTSLMHLRTAEGLPRWTRQADGHWVPDEEP